MMARTALPHRRKSERFEPHAESRADDLLGERRARRVPLPDLLRRGLDCSRPVTIAFLGYPTPARAGGVWLNQAVQADGLGRPRAVREAAAELRDARVMHTRTAVE
jgi:hypothetical protein